MRPRIVHHWRDTSGLRGISDPAIRTLKNFDGYQVLGEELTFIAHAIEEQWYEDKSLPTDLDQLKGALFFMNRKMHFVDGYPDKGDVPFLEALVRAIAAGEK